MPAASWLAAPTTGRPGAGQKQARPASPGGQQGQAPGQPWRVPRVWPGWRHAVAGVEGVPHTRQAESQAPSCPHSGGEPPPAAGPAWGCRAGVSGAPSGQARPPHSCGLPVRFSPAPRWDFRVCVDDGVKAEGSGLNLPGKVSTGGLGHPRRPPPEDTAGVAGQLHAGGSHRQSSATWCECCASGHSPDLAPQWGALGPAVGFCALRVKHALWACHGRLD